MHRTWDNLISIKTSHNKLNTCLIAWTQSHAYIYSSSSSLEVAQLPASLHDSASWTGQLLRTDPRSSVTRATILQCVHGMRSSKKVTTTTLRRWYKYWQYMCPFCTLWLPMSCAQHARTHIQQYSPRIYQQVSTNKYSKHWSGIICIPSCVYTMIVYTIRYSVEMASDTLVFKDFPKAINLDTKVSWGCQ